MRQPGDWRLFCIIVGLFAVAWSAALILTAGGAKADVFVTNTQPYGGCKEAHLAPHSPGARECRDRGWVIRARITITPSGLATTTLPRCKAEDSNRCRWNAVTMGNEKGRGFVTAGEFRWYVDKINGHKASTRYLYRYDRYYRGDAPAQVDAPALP